MDARIVSVNADNVAEEGFFCYKSKPKSDGNRQKIDWLRQRCAEGMKIHILYEGKRSVGFIEYIPGEYTWRAVEAGNYMVIHCLWVVGSGKGKGYGSQLLDLCVQDAQQSGWQGVAMVTTAGPWLASKKLFLKQGFTQTDQAPPGFELMVKRFGDFPLPAFPTDWTERARQFGSGLTILYSGQCPYHPDAVKIVLEAAQARGIEAKAIELKTAEEVRRCSPSPYGVFGVVYNGELVSYRYFTDKEIIEWLSNHAG